MSHTIRRAALAVLAACAPVVDSIAAAAGPVYPGSAAPAIEITQRVGAQLPLESRFTDADGRAVRLGDFFTGRGGVPVVLVLGYYRCPRLCETVMEGALDGLAESQVPRSDYRIVAVSIDPAETPADAAARRRSALAYADVAAERVAAMPAARNASSPDDLPRDSPVTSPRHGAERVPVDLHPLVGDAASIDMLASRVGFGFARHDVAEGTRDDVATFDHAVGFMVATPEGRVSGYLLGVRHDPAAVRAALETARENGIGRLVERLVLLCAHVDPSVGRWSVAVLVGLRLLGCALAIALLMWIWRHRRPAATGVGP